MKLNTAQIEKTQLKLGGEAIPAEHPMMPQLRRLFGDHTYFLDGNGLSIVEPVEPKQSTIRQGVVVNLANWADANAESLQPHEPEPTDKVVDLEAGTRH
jgi:hypothetical protein